MSSYNQISKRPSARTSEIVCEELAGECVIYDSLQKKVHHLNPTMTWIWLACTGNDNVEEITQAFERHFNVSNASQVVLRGLTELQSLNLLETPIDLSGVSPAIVYESVSRRTVIVGTSLLMPAVVSVLAPTAAAAKSKPDKPGKKDKD